MDSVKRELRRQMCVMESRVGLLEGKIEDKMDRILELLGQRPDSTHPA
jgi:hypothetical protein